jgi:hypothetical protein
VLIAAGALSAAAASAAAVTAAQGPPRSHAAGALIAAAGIPLTVADQVPDPPAVQQSSVSPAIRAYQIRVAEADFAAAHWKAARRQAARKAAAQRAAVAATAQSPATAQAPVVTDVAASGSPQQIAEAMLGSFGWSSGQFSCLDSLWELESGWSVTAYNAGSGAYGIPQALPGSKMASAGPDWQTDAATQIRWGLEYIQSLYGSPCGAWDHEQATGWY